MYRGDEDNVDNRAAGQTEKTGAPGGKKQQQRAAKWRIGACCLCSE